MRILQAMAGAKYGGAENFFVRLALGLNRAGITQRVIIRRNSIRAESLRKGGIRPLETSFGGMFDWRTKLLLKQQISKFKPDIVLTWMNRATIKMPSGPFIHIGRLGGYYDLKYYEACDYLIGNTDKIVEYIISNGWSNNKAQYLPNFVKVSPGSSSIRKEFFTPEFAPLILVMGRLHKNKAFDIILRALTKIPNTYLWIAGDGPLKNELQNLSIELGVKPRVRFLGWQENTGDLLRACDVLVCPSRHEPLGNVIIEAWAHSKPVVATNCAGPGDLIDHLQSGILVPIDDHATLAKEVESILINKDFGQKMALKGHNIYLEKFTEKIVVEKYIEFFKELLGS